MYELIVSSDFAAAHFLREYHGKCENLHGHTWKVELTLNSDKLDNLGMVMDFKTVKKELNDFLEQFDHKCINDLPHFKEANPTTENIAKYIFEEFSKISAPIKITKVKVWESENCSATYFE